MAGALLSIHNSSGTLLITSRSKNGRKCKKLVNLFNNIILTSKHLLKKVHPSRQCITSPLLECLVIDLRHRWIVQWKETISQLVYGKIIILNPFIDVGKDLKSHRCKISPHKKTLPHGLTNFMLIIYLKNIFLNGKILC
jgi:hypothetical protein